MRRRGFITPELLVRVLSIAIVLAITTPLGIRLREAGHTIAGGVVLLGPLVVLAGMCVYGAVRIVKDDGWTALLKVILMFGSMVLLGFGLASLCSSGNEGTGSGSGMRGESASVQHAVR